MTAAKRRDKASKRRAGGAARGVRADAKKRARPVLGNDPFTRGAAERPAPVAALPGTSAAAPPSATPPVGVEAPSAAPPAPRADVLSAASARLGDLERRVESALDGLDVRLSETVGRTGLAAMGDEVREAAARLLPKVKDVLAGAVDLARLLEPPERLDRFGQDLRFTERAQPLLELLYGTWWRVETRGLEHVPAIGPAIVVANHAGFVPWDALVLRHALRRDHPAGRDLRPLLDDRECALPLFGPLAIRLGAVRASADAAARILGGGDLVGVFPEGSVGARKPWRERYRIQRFGRGGFVKVALRAGVPIVPCAIVGSEEASPGIARTGWLAERLGLPVLSRSALRVGPAALLPLPSRWSLRFGAPVDLHGLGPATAEDAAAVNDLTEAIRARLQGMVDEGLAARGSVFL